MLRSINFNLIPILRELLKTQSVTRSAQILGLTQSGVSAALQRLREALCDPLLVRVGHTMRLTARAEELIEPVEELCAMLERLLIPAEFDPSSLARVFSVAAADWFAVHIAATLIPFMRANAPGVQLRFAEADRDSFDKVRRGELDLLVVPDVALREIPATSLRSRPLFEDVFVAVVGHRSDLTSLEHHVCLNRASNRSKDANLRDALSGRIWGPGVNAQLSQLAFAPLLALDTDTIAMVPRSLAEIAQRWLPLKIVDLGDQSVKLDLRLAWGAVSDQDPAHRWFREALCSVSVPRTGEATATDDV